MISNPTIILTVVVATCLLIGGHLITGIKSCFCMDNLKTFKYATLVGIVVMSASAAATNFVIAINNL